MSKTKAQIIDGIVQREAGFVDNPHDSGGPTKWGITEQVARAYGYRDNIRHLPVSLAHEIYSDWYWDPVRGDDLHKVSPALAEEVVDTRVNMWTLAAGKFLQQSLNVLNRRGLLYSDIKVDGLIGRVTVAACRQYAEHRDIETLVKAMNCLQGAAYIQLAKRREKDEEFVYGWLIHRVVIDKE